MNRLHTCLTALALGATVVAGGVVLTATSANAAPLDAVASAVSDSATAGGQAVLSTAPSDGSAAMGGARAKGVRQWWQGLTDTERSCLKDAGLTRPVGPLNDAERTALREQVAAAAKTCGVELPFAKARAFWNSLSDTQQRCLKEVNVTRPVGPLTAQERATVRANLAAAAQTCGVTLPSKAATAGS